MVGRQAQEPQQSLQPLLLSGFAIPGVKDPQPLSWKSISQGTFHLVSFCRFLRTFFGDSKAFSC